MVESDPPTHGQFFNFNGVDLDGNYLVASLSAEQLLEFAQDEFGGISGSEQTRIRALSLVKGTPNYGFDALLHDPAESGWGVIVHQNTSGKIKVELEKLVEHRANYYKITPRVFEVNGTPEYLQFLSEHGVSPGLGEVEKVPYYLLIAGDPVQIPFRFQHDLGSEYAVGRLSFSDEIGYRAYIDQLIDYETATEVPTSRKAVFWGTANLEDQPTRLSSHLLVRPLHESLGRIADLELELFLASEAGKEASKSNLVGVLSRPRAPALLFSASHGVGFQTINEQQQVRLQGALVAQDWQPGSPVTPSIIYSGEDIVDQANVRGMVHFAFACFGAGTPSHDDYSQAPGEYARIIAPFPFVSNLANQELIHGSLGFIGHVDRAWGYSFISPGGESQNLGFERAIRNMLSEKRAWPIGHCLRDLYDRALHLSKSLLEDLNDLAFGRKIPPIEIANKWKERNDARAYALVGDPAVRLRISEMN